MKKLSDFIVEKRNIFLVIFIILAGVSLFSSKYVNINSDITKYLPNSSETRIGKEIMDSSFEEEKSSNLNVMFKDLSDSEKQEVYDKLKNIEGVSSVDYDSTSEYNKDEYTLYVVNVDDYSTSTLAKDVYTNISENFDVSAMSGSIYEKNKSILELWIIVLAISMAMVILILMSDSFVEPFLYLFSIGIAVFINKGTNIIFPSVSEITDSITAILQLALSVDYSIMLSNRYSQEKETEKDKVKAMKKALYHSFNSISSSSLTTIMGLLALVFMSFTIGRDLGFVLAKGVLFSLICIFFCLPGLLLLFDNLIAKTKKKTFKFNLRKLGSFSYKTRYLQLVIIIVAFILSYLFKGNLEILYTASEQDEVGKVFPATNQMAIIYKNEYEDTAADYCRSITNGSNITNVLCYGNTIGEKLAYNELNKKISDLGQDTEIDEYLIKLIYYKYNNKDNISISYDDFISFIKSNIYTNNKFSPFIDSNIKDKVSLLENFTNEDLINKSRSASEISNILGIDERSVSNLLVLYNSSDVSNKMTISEFVSFMYSDVLNDKTYSSSIDNNTLKSLEQLKLFADKKNITKKMTASQISKLYGIDEDTVNQLFLFYRTTVDSSSKLSLNEFSSFVLNDVLSDSSYSSLLDDSTIAKLQILNKLSNDEFINKELTSTEMSSLLSSYGLNKDVVDRIYLYYTITNDTDTKLSLNEFATFALTLANNQEYSSYFTSELIQNLNIIKLYSDHNTINASIDYTNMSTLLNMDQSFVQMIYSTYFNTLGNNDQSTWKLTPYEFLNIVISNENVMSSLNDEQVSKLKMLYGITYSATQNLSYSYTELSNFLGMNDKISLIKMLYGIYDYSNTDIKISTNNLVNFILNHKDDEVLKDSVSSYIEILTFAKNIMDNTSNKFSYTELSSILSIDSSVAKSIYSLYDYKNNNTLLTPYEFTNLILKNTNNSMLKGKIDNNSINQLKLTYNIMYSTLNNIKYNTSSLSKVLGINEDSLKLIYSLYDFKNNSSSVSLYDFSSFILEDVVTDSKYKDQFTNEDIDKLNTVYSVMSSSLKNEVFTSRELYNNLSKLSDELSFDLVDIIYTYYGSVNLYKTDWKMTVEEFINYLNNTILKDSQFSKFIDDDMSEKITSSYTTINDAKKLLVSDKYSRVVINTKYAFESEDTFKFIQKALDTFDGKDGIYVVGDSPMALEMSKSFNSELDFITILTMLFIFVVVAFTFKSILIPFILVLLIQCAVYVTMDYLSLMGGNVYFISLLIVQAILMGATIDYAIVYTSYYKESRMTMNIKDSIINAYNKSIHTILTSSSILIIVTLVVANFASAIAAKICETVSQGAFCAALLILLILPGVLASSDKFICRKGFYQEKSKK